MVHLEWLDFCIKNWITFRKLLRIIINPNSKANQEELKACNVIQSWDKDLIWRKLITLHCDLRSGMLCWLYFLFLVTSTQERKLSPDSYAFFTILWLWMISMDNCNKPNLLDINFCHVIFCIICHIPSCLIKSKEEVVTPLNYIINKYFSQDSFHKVAKVFPKHKKAIKHW